MDNLDAPPLLMPHEPIDLDNLLCFGDYGRPVSPLRCEGCKAAQHCQKFVRAEKLAPILEKIDALSQKLQRGGQFGGKTA